MNKIESALWADYDEAGKKLNDLKVESDHYDIILDDKDRIRKEIIEIEQIKQETNIKMSQIESENIREKNRNKLALLNFGITTGVTVVGMILTFKFDKVATITSTMGRGILNGLVPKFNKR